MTEAEIVSKLWDADRAHQRGGSEGRWRLAIKAALTHLTPHQIASELQPVRTVDEVLALASLRRVRPVLVEATPETQALSPEEVDDDD